MKAKTALFCVLAAYSGLGMAVDVVRVAEREGVDPALLYAVALAESARPVGGNRIAAWPWTIRSSRHGARFFATRGQAEEHLRQLLAEGVRNIDVGPMQINLQYHGSKVDDPIHLLDPDFNLVVGARILRQAIGSSSDPVIGVGRYHSWDTARSYTYGIKVWKIYDAIRHYLAF